jgi:hypothetical protein
MKQPRAHCRRVELFSDAEGSPHWPSSERESAPLMGGTHVPDA